MMNYISIIFTVSLLITIVILFYFLVNEFKNIKIRNIISVNLLTILLYNVIAFIIFKFTTELLLATFAFNHIICFSVFVIINNHNKQQITKDQLTGLNNKACFLQYIKKQKGHNAYLIIGDIDKLKKINDIYGHLEGDNALKSISKALLRVGEKHQHLFISRFGGDEFVLIYNSNNINSVNDLINELHYSIKEEDKKVPYNLSVSFGFSKLDKGNYKNSFRKADAQMYSFKK